MRLSPSETALYRVRKLRALCREIFALALSASFDGRRSCVLGTAASRQVCTCHSLWAAPRAGMTSGGISAHVASPPRPQLGCEDSASDSASLELHLNLHHWSIGTRINSEGFRSELTGFSSSSTLDSRAATLAEVTDELADYEDVPSRTCPARRSPGPSVRASVEHPVCIVG